MNYTISPLIKNAEDLDDISAERHYNKYFNTRLKLIRHSSISKGMCFNYATKNYNLEYCEDCWDYIKNYYKSVNIKDLKIGDVVVFYDSFEKEPVEGTVNHFGIIVKTGNINSIIIRSKWGLMGIYEGRLIDLPSEYGDRVKFYRRNDD